MIVAVQFALTAMAVYGIAFTMAFLHGPFGMCAALRQRIKARFAGREWIVTGVQCPICLSFWLAWPALLWLQWPPAALAAAPWLAWYVMASLATVGIVAWLSK